MVDRLYARDGVEAVLLVAGAPLAGAPVAVVQPGKNLQLRNSSLSLLCPLPSW